MEKINIRIFICFAIFLVLCSGQEDIDYPTLKSGYSYCFEFTWIGPDYNNVTGYNGTCDDYKDETRAGDDIPCISPLVISNDGTLPDLDYLWKYYRASVLCIRSESQACVKYSYIYNGIVANQSHMCARVRADKTQVTSGCYKQEQDGYEIELCVCKSGYGLSTQPCNSSSIFSATTAIILIGFFILWLVK